MSKEPRPLTDATKHYRWPWFVLAVVLLGILLAVLWMLGAISRARQIRESTRQAAAYWPAAIPSPADQKSWTNGMVWIPPGRFLMGSEIGQRDEKPVHEVYVDGFWMDRTEVSNEDFDRFVRATGYVTVAEQKPDPKLYPQVPAEKLVPGSIVFRPPPGEVSLENHYIWWEYVPGANWRHPEGPASTIVGRQKHPVVHVCWFDAVKYAEWAGKRLPTE